MSDCIAIVTGCAEAFLEFDSIADQSGSPLLNGLYSASGVSRASQVAPLLTATLSQFPSVVQFEMNSSRAMTNAIVCSNLGPSPACILLSLNPLDVPVSNTVGFPIAPGQSLLFSKPSICPSPPGTTPTPLCLAGGALQNQAVISLRFGNVTLSYRFPANGPI